MNSSLYNDCFNCDFSTMFKDKGYSYFTKGNYNLNIIGIRSSKSVHQSNRFDDIILIEYFIDNSKYKKLFAATTDPGLSTLLKPIAAKGTAILVPGQYKQCWEIGKHKGQYEALTQCSSVKVYRDNNKDDILDFDIKTIDKGLYGINIHKAGEDSMFVNGWSAGCQVIARRCDFNILMKLCHSQIEAGMGRKFTYTLIDEKDLFNYLM